MQLLVGVWHVRVVVCAVTCECVACVGGGVWSYLWVCGMCGWWCVQLIVGVWHVWVVVCAVNCGCVACVGGGVCS